MKNSKLKKILFLIFIVALFLRLFAVFTQEESRKLPLSDAKDYDKMSLKFFIIVFILASFFIAIMIIKLIMFPVHY